MFGFERALAEVVLPRGRRGVRNGVPADKTVGDEGEARVRAAYPGATWERLTRIKARYDPTNLFRRNQNSPPANG